MRPGIHSLAWAMLISGSLVGGCQHPSGTDAYPKDPLILSKKPVEGPIDASPIAVQLASVEPATPPTPFAALAVLTPLDSTASKPPDALASGRGAINVQPAIRGRGPTPAVPAVRSAPAPDAAYGRAPDFTWIMGVLDRRYQGHFDLRFGDASAADGGKVSLEPDARLGQFQDGDVVRVEGELATVEQGTTWSHYPRYRVRDVKLVQRKN